jgi:hypothetical protein
MSQSRSDHLEFCDSASLCRLADFDKKLARSFDRQRSRGASVMLVCEISKTSLAVKLGHERTV